MKKTKMQLEIEIIEVLNTKPGKKVEVADQETLCDVYFKDGITYECLLKTVYVGIDDGWLHVDVESAQGYEQWETSIDLIDDAGCEIICRQLGIALEWAPTMQESYDIICKHFEHLKDSIRDYVKARVDKHGILLLKDTDEVIRPCVITTQEYNRLPDEYTECRCIALRVMDYDVQFCALPSSMFDEETQYCSATLAKESNAHLWYTLDWDCANPFQHNIERIAYYLTQTTN